MTPPPSAHRSIPPCLADGFVYRRAENHRRLREGCMGSTRVPQRDALVLLLDQAVLDQLRQRMMQLADPRLIRMPEQFRMNVVALVGLRLVHFEWNPVGVGPGILTNAGHLPGNL